MKIVALAYNFESLGSVSKDYPFFFFKNPDSIIGPSDEIRIPKRWHVWPEAELALRIGPNHNEQPLFDAITVANDVTAANVEGRNVHLPFSKCMDTFLPMGSWKTDLDLDNVLNYCMMFTAVNNVRVQTGKLADMICSPSEAYYYISKYMTLKQGDILLMGTCFHKHYPLRDGDVVECDIYTDDPWDITVGALINPVVEV